MAFTINWDQAGDRLYETGVKRGVLYVKQNGAYQPGVAWNGLTAVTESPSGAEATALYADDIKYLNLMSAEEFGATIEAYTYPEEFEVCNGSKSLVNGMYIGQQTRSTFGLCYTTTVGNDELGNGYGRKLHIIYNALAAPSEKAYATVNDSPEAITFSWEISTTPVTETVNGEQITTASITIDSTKFSAEDMSKFEALETKLFGDGEEEGSLPTVEEIYNILSGTNA